MMNVTPFEAYKKYLALKLHFTSNSYDYFKFCGKVKADKESFQKRNDKYWFTKIANKFTPEEFEQYLVANFVADAAVWIGSLNDDKSKKQYLTWKGKMETLQYNFKQDIQTIKDNQAKCAFNDLFKQDPNNNYPPIVQLAMQDNISLETFIILNIIFDFLPKVDTLITERLVWPEFKNKCMKYQPFVAKKIVVGEYKKILVREFKQTK